MVVTIRMARLGLTPISEPQLAVELLEPTREVVGEFEVALVELGGELVVQIGMESVG